MPDRISIARGKKHEDDRRRKKTMYDQYGYETIFEGIDLGLSDDHILNVLQRLLPDAVMSWNKGDVVRARGQYKVYWPERVPNQYIPELKAILDRHTVGHEAQYEILHWVLPRLRKKILVSLSPPMTKQCNQCGHFLPVTVQYWHINRTGGQAGEVWQPCRLCDWRVWKRNRYKGGKK
jgi:hypothetical protein